MRDLRLTQRGWIALYCVLAVVLTGMLIWADAAMSIPGVDDARVDAEQLR